MKVTATPSPELMLSVSCEIVSLSSFVQQRSSPFFMQPDYLRSQPGCVCVCVCGKIKTGMKFGWENWAAISSNIPPGLLSVRPTFFQSKSEPRSSPIAKWKLKLKLRFNERAGFLQEGLEGSVPNPPQNNYRICLGHLWNTINPESLASPKSRSSLATKMTLSMRFSTVEFNSGQ